MSLNSCRTLNIAPGILFAVAALSLVLASAAVAQDASPATPSDAADEAAQSQGKMMLDDDEVSAGMHLKFDGSSEKAFEESLEKIKGEVTDAEYVTVQNAIDYLLVYDLAARRDPNELYKRLDGKTPAEMLKMVNWQTGKRGTRSR